MVTLGSGVQYKVLQSASPGAKRVQAGVPFHAHYSGRLHDKEEPYFTTFRHGHYVEILTNDGHLVKGAVEAALLMSVGDKWEIYIPSELAYGNSSPGGVSESVRPSCLTPLNSAQS